MKERSSVFVSGIAFSTHMTSLGFYAFVAFGCVPIYTQANGYPTYPGRYSMWLLTTISLILLIGFSLQFDLETVGKIIILDVITIVGGFASLFLAGVYILIPVIVSCIAYLFMLEIIYKAEISDDSKASSDQTVKMIYTAKWILISSW